MTIIYLIINIIFALCITISILRRTRFMRKNEENTLFVDNYKEFLESINLGTLVLNKTTKETIFYNRSLKKIFSIKNEINYQTIFKDKKIVKEIENILDSKNYLNEILTEGKYFIISTTTIYDLVFVFFNDITQVKNNELMKRRYIDSISHELKTPLTNILLYSELLMCKESVCKNEVDIINKNALSLKKMISDILELSKLDSPDIRINTNEINLRKLFIGIMNDLIPIAEKNGIDIEVNVSSDLKIEGNEELLYKAFKNLVENSIKYNTSGGLVQIKAKKVDDKIEIKIIDNGDGISKKDLEHIFERFYRVDKSRTKGATKDGTGLGLSIVENILRVHKCKIEVESKLKEGTTFIMKYPI